MARTSGSKIVDGMRDAVAHARGDETAARVYIARVPDNVDVRAIRNQLRMSQKEFALMFGFALGTIRNWEQGRRLPSGSDRVLLTLIHRAPDQIHQLLVA